MLFWVYTAIFFKFGLILHQKFSIRITEKIGKFQILIKMGIYAGMTQHEIFSEVTKNNYKNQLWRNM